MSDTAQALAQFARDYSKACENETGKLPQVSFDESWRSPCEVGDVSNDEKITWQHVMQSPVFDFSDIEAALDLALHQSVKEFYGTYFGASIFAKFDGQQYELISVGIRMILSA